MRRVGVLLSLVFLWGVGCNRDQHARMPVHPTVDPGRLPGLRATTDLALRDELARIEEEGGTPELMMRAPVPPQRNAAAGLRELFTPAEASQLLAESGELFPSGRFTFTSPALEKAIQFKARYDRQRQQAREALRRPVCDLGIRYMAGFGADLSLVDTVRLCTRLEAFEAAECLDKSKIDGAVEAFREMLRLSFCLAAERHITVRVQGAYNRTEALTVLQAIVQHPGFNRSHLDQLSGTFRTLLAHWPDDADAWRGDRAIGLHAYELVRAGHAEKLLTPEEAEQLSARGILADFPKITKRGVDRDERFYLQAMRRIIESCKEPYSARLALFADLRNSLQQRSNSSDYPIVAGRLLLTQVQEGHAVQAQDRANCEAWALALALAGGQPAPAYTNNPQTGQKYRILQEKGSVEVGSLCATKWGTPITVIVPDLSRAQVGK